MEELIKRVDIDVPGGVVKITQVLLTGDASLSFRKGRKLVFFDFVVECEWDGQLVDGEGRSLGTGESRSCGVGSVSVCAASASPVACLRVCVRVRAGDGKLSIPELDQDSGDDYRIELQPSDDPGSKDRQLEALFRKHGVKELRRLIDRFVAELKAKT